MNDSWEKGRNLLTWQVDKKIPGGMNLQSPLECTITFVGKALLKAVEAELNKSMSGDQILKKNKYTGKNKYWAKSHFMY